MLIFYVPALVIRSAGPRPTLIELITFPHQAVDFLVYPWKSIPSVCFPNWDEFVYTLLKSGSKRIPHALYCSDSKVRLFVVQYRPPSWTILAGSNLPSCINGYYDGPALTPQA